MGMEGNGNGNVKSYSRTSLVKILVRLSFYTYSSVC